MIMAQIPWGHLLAGVLSVASPEEWPRTPWLTATPVAVVEAIQKKTALWLDVSLPKERGGFRWSTYDEKFADIDGGAYRIAAVDLPERDDFSVFENTREDWETVTEVIFQINGEGDFNSADYKIPWDVAEEFFSIVQSVRKSITFFETLRSFSADDIAFVIRAFDAGNTGDLDVKWIERLVRWVIMFVDIRENVEFARDNGYVRVDQEWRVDSIGIMRFAKNLIEDYPQIQNILTVAYMEETRDIYIQAVAAMRGLRETLNNEIEAAKDRIEAAKDKIEEMDSIIQRMDELIWQMWELKLASK